MDFLSNVKKYKQLEIEKLAKTKNRFEQLFVTNRKDPIFIAEIKPKSATEGILYEGDFVKLAQEYENAGVDAISILTDQPSFGGSLKLLHDVSQSVNLPILRKDFILSKIQIIESLKNHADAMLLIVSLLDQQKLSDLINFSYELGLVPIVEVVSEKELDTAIKAGAKIIGVNARNLHTLDVDYENALEVLKKIPRSITPLLFSGIKTQSDVQKAVDFGAKGILVGTSLLKAKNVQAKIKELKNNFIIKICGVKDIPSAERVIKYSPSMVGLIFVPNSIRCIDFKTAKEISKLAHKQNISVVGVFQNQPVEQIINLVKTIPLDYVQLHGGEDASYCKQISVPIIKKITLENVKEKINKYKNVVNIFLVDRPKQGQGSLVNKDEVRKLSEKYNVMVAGGLNKDNVGNIIRKTGKSLQGIDVSSGVEKVVGEKDEKLVSKFIEQARGIYETI